jgi:hypothetical protein
MPTVIHLTYPPFQVAMALVLVSDPIRLSLERFGLLAFIICACEWLHILMYVLGPIGWLLKFLGFEAQLTLKLRGEVACRRHWDALRECLLSQSTLSRVGIIVGEVCDKL